jgi:hypothetical protein
MAQVTSVPVLKRWLLLGLVLVAIIWACILAWKWPFTEEKVATALQQDFHNPIRIGSFHPTFFPLGYIAENITFVGHDSGREIPAASVRKLVVTARYSDLLLMRKRAEGVSLIGLHTVISHATTSSHMPPRFLEIDQVKIEDAIIEFSSDSTGDPLRITIKSFVLDRLNRKSSSPFHAEMATNEPQGTVQSAGQIGPWNWNNAGQTHLSGSFTFKQADLKTVGDIKGLLAARGKFDGSLSHVVCYGTVDVPHFGTLGGKHLLPLSATFKATVNGLNGDTTLDHAESRLDHTVVQSQGTIQGDGQHPGKAARLHLSVQDGQVDDLLLLFTRSPQPSMTGAISLEADAAIPPGAPGFLKKLRLQGDFGMSNSRFTKTSTQAPINHLSESAEGMSKREEYADAKTVLSNVAGHVSAQNGIATLSQISFEVPGAQAKMSGTYDLIDKTVQLQGTLRTTGKLSDTTSGMKAGLLKIISPFLKKHSVTTVPFSITGNVHHPVFALELGKKQRT